MKRWLALTCPGACAGVVALALVPAWHPPMHQPIIEKPASHPAPHVIVTTPVSRNPTEPIRLIIPVLGIDGAVQGGGVDAAGNMAVPPTPDALTWYRAGFLPGSLGNAVIAGHLNYSRRTGVFSRLDELQIGDSVQIINTVHNKLYFKVTRKQAYHPDTAPLSEIFGKSTKAQLNLITCDGEWDARRHAYTERLVVFSEFVREETS